MSAWDRTAPNRGDGVRLRVAGIVPNSIADGPGLRFTVFVQGCARNCPGCQNPQTHDPNGGEEMAVEDIAAQIRADPLLDGLSLSGGEPMEQAAGCLALARSAHARGLTVWCWTGFSFEELISGGSAEQTALLGALDVLVDGPFLREQRTLNLPWRGSQNQRVLDVVASLAAGSPVRLEFS